VVVTDEPDPGRVAELAAFVQPAVVQWYGWAPDTVGVLRQGVPSGELWVSVGVEERDGGQAEERLAAAIAAGADRVVLDTARAGRSGGTGQAMDWGLAAGLVRRARPTPVVLAGGLTPGNVAEAVRQVGPAAVDVSSGVETAPSAKSARLIRAFVEAVREVTSR
jgi:phosphoribosylanthranilate isomerase